ncbi:MAG: hypothetical protein Q9191_006511 [Dirinaria sp. TL-2023a]
MAMSVLFGCVGLENFYIPVFMMRHQKRETFLRDETRKRINTWVTELHVSFYSIIHKPVDPEDSDSDEYEDDDYIGSGSNDPSLFDEGLRPCPGRPEWMIERSIISVHFCGDLNDRYWTSHVFYNIPNERRSFFADEYSFALTNPSGEGNKNTFHSQRKVLEVRWFAKAMKYVADETQRILNYVSELIRKDDNRFYNSKKSDTFKKTFEQNKKTYVLYGDIIKILFDVKQSLRGVYSIAKEWDDRAKFREVQPRWTRDDQAAYGAEILLSTKKCKGQVHNISSLLERTEGLIEHAIQLRQWLLDDLALKEARMSNRSADDVRIFTYATVIFLPLSFVASVFAMTGAPDRAIVQPFIIAAAVALLATIAFLLNAGTPMRNIAYYKNEILRLPQDDSILEHGDSQWRAVLKALYWWLFRMPAQNVLIARGVLAARRKSHKQHKKTIGSTGGPKTSNTVEREKTGPLERRKSVTDEMRRKQQRGIELKEKQQWRRDTRKIIVGILVLPPFLFVTILKFACQNLFDLTKLLFLTLPRYPNRRLEQEISEEDHKSILSHTISSAEEQAKKNIKIDDTADELRRDLRRKETNYHEGNLERFMAMPRIDDLGKYLQKGETLGTARKKLKAERESSKEEFRKIKKQYTKARKKVVQKAKMTNVKIPEIDLSHDFSSDDSLDIGRSASKENLEQKHGRFISGIFRSHFRQSKQQVSDAESAQAKASVAEV